MIQTPFIFHHKLIAERRVRVPMEVGNVSSAVHTYAPHEFLNKSCQVCGIGDVDEDWILICDGCDQEYHTYCLAPAIHEIPAGDWFCPLCSTSGRTSELRSYFTAHDQMKRKMKTRSAYLSWLRRRQFTWRKSLETEGFSPPAAGGPEFAESEELIGQLVLLHIDVHTVHTGDPHVPHCCTAVLVMPP
jgi:hypothetical protein